jgi:[ribosomal protein S5]-alanine N-acetyltransferase
VARAELLPNEEMKLRVSVSQPRAEDVPELIELACASRGLHTPWVYLPRTQAAWRRYLRRVQQEEIIAYLVRRRDTQELVGVVNLPGRRGRRTDPIEVAFVIP